jgi:DNA-binding YbaB/EbfC family protein
MQGLGDLLRQAQEIQGKMADMQEELGKKTVQGSSGGGMVTVLMNGRQEVLSVRIEKPVIDPEEADMLQDLVAAAVNDAIRNTRQLAEQNMASITGGLKIPGLF